jgi:hypothetical protein
MGMMNCDRVRAGFRDMKTEVVMSFSGRDGKCLFPVGAVTFRIESFDAAMIMMLCRAVGKRLTTRKKSRCQVEFVRLLFKRCRESP